MGDNSDYEAVKQQIAECTGIYIQIGHKKITEVPPLPEHIISICLNGYHDMLLKFPEVYSSQLKAIMIWGTGIKELPENLPDTVESIDLIETGICKLPTKLPKNLKRLKLSSSRIEVIPELPETLEMFECSSNYYIQYIPKFPDRLHTLNLSFTDKITELPNPLPSHLTQLNIQHSSIKSLPKLLPNSLRSLDIRYASIKDISENIPDKLVDLHVSNTYLPYLRWDYKPKEKLRHFITHRQCMVDIRIENTWYHSRKRCIARCKAIKERLMAATWHPDRVLDWCDPKAFDYDD